MLSARRLGELTREIETAKPGPKDNPTDGSNYKRATLKGLGIRSQDASRWERLAEVEDYAF